MMTQTRKTFSGNKARKALKQGVQRYDNGKIVNRDRGESEADVMRTAVDARSRLFGVPKAAVKEDAAKGLLGSAIGRLLYAKEITAHQYAVAVRFARVTSLHNLIHDVRPGYGVPASARIGIASGRDPYDNIDPEQAWDVTDAKRRMDTIMKIRRDYADLTRAAWEMEALQDTRGAAALLTRVLMWDDGHCMRDTRDRGTFRCGLNVIGKMWGML